MLGTPCMHGQTYFQLHLVDRQRPRQTFLCTAQWCLGCCAGSVLIAVQVLGLGRRPTLNWKLFRLKKNK